VPAAGFGGADVVVARTRWACVSWSLNRKRVGTSDKMRPPRRASCAMFPRPLLPCLGSHG
jgi:hypothetical protein